jgi:hypothetical protein
VRFSLHGSEALQGGAEPDGFEKRILRDMRESDADVIGMVKAGGKRGPVRTPQSS